MTGSSRVRTALACGLVVAAALADHGRPATAQEQLGPRPDYRGRGTVLRLLTPPSDLHPTEPVMVIEHEPIPGLMNETMIHPFLAASAGLFRGLREGDRIAFGLKDVPGALLVVTVERLRAGQGR